MHPQPRVFAADDFASRATEIPNGVRDRADQSHLLKHILGHAALDELEGILKFAKEHGMFVIGFAPPYAPTIYAEMMAA